MSDLVQLQPAGSAAMVVAGEGFEGFSLKPAVLKLVQNTTTDEGAVKGQLFDTLSRSNFPSMQVVPLSIRVGRVMFPPDGDLGAEPICRSNDGIVPSPDAQVPQSDKCATCDHGPKMWKDFRATGKKPDCQEKFRMLFVARDSGLPYYITIGGKSISHLKKLKDAIFRDVLASRMKGEQRNLYDYTFEMKPVATQGRRGNYYELAFINLSKIKEPGEFGQLYEMFVKRAKAEEASPADEAVDAEFVEDSTEETYQGV